MAVIDYARTNKEGVTAEGAIQTSFQSFFINQMKNFFNGDLECVINNKTGEVLISGNINLYNGEGLTEDNLLSTTSTPITENAGNMIKSNYLTIEAENLPNNGWIESTNCLFIKTNTELFDLKIDYKYRYL